MASREGNMIGGNAYDRWKTEPPEPHKAGTCTQCNEEIMSGEEVYIVGGDTLVHQDCWKDYSIMALDAELGIVSSPFD